MIVLCSGEGSSDIGVSVYDAERGTVTGVKWGAVGSILMRMLEECRGDEHDSDEHCLVLKDEVADKAKSVRTQFFPGEKHGKGSAYFRKAAYGFGLIASDKAKEEGEDVIAVLFRDSDPSNSTCAVWQDKFDSVDSGFKAAGFDCGIPMIPKPTSEAWLLALCECHADNCCALESETDRDALKKNLDKKLQSAGLGHEDFYLSLRDGSQPLGNLEYMPSFNAFKNRFCKVLKNRVRNRACFAAHGSCDTWKMR